MTSQAALRANPRTPPDGPMAFPRILWADRDVLTIPSVAMSPMRVPPRSVARPVPPGGGQVRRPCSGSAPAKWRSFHGRWMTLAVALAASVGLGIAAHQALFDGGWASRGAVSLEALMTSIAEPPTSTIPPRQRQAIDLTRTTLLALNDANRSGDYSLLRDLAGPRFQARNSAQQLSAAFAPFRLARLDFGVASEAAPTFLTNQVREGDGVLVLDGHVPLAGPHAAHRLRFALEFAPIQGQWRLLTLSIAVELGQ